jgi:hypothetical protein
MDDRTGEIRSPARMAGLPLVMDDQINKFKSKAKLS